MNTHEALGVDIGGVIIDRANDKTDTSFFGNNFLQTTKVPGVFEALQCLVAGKFGERTHLVSKCGPAVEEKTRRWLMHHGFYDITCIKPEHVYFCRARRDKAGICATLGITHFIDDRLEVLGCLPKTVKYQYLFQPDSREVQRFSRFLPQVCQVQSWQEILAALL